MQLDREMLTWQDLFMDIYMDILRQTAVGLEVYYLTLFTGRRVLYKCANRTGIITEI